MYPTIRPHSSFASLLATVTIMPSKAETDKLAKAKAKEEDQQQQRLLKDAAAKAAKDKAEAEAAAKADWVAAAQQEEAAMEKDAKEKAEKAKADREKDDKEKAGADNADKAKTDGNNTSIALVPDVVCTMCKLPKHSSECTAVSKYTTRCNACSKVHGRQQRLFTVHEELREKWKSIGADARVGFFRDNQEKFGADLKTVLEVIVEEGVVETTVCQDAAAGRWLDEEDIEEEFKHKPKKKALIYAKCTKKTHPVLGHTTWLYTEMMTKVTEETEAKKSHKRTLEGDKRMRPVKAKKDPTEKKPIESGQLEGNHNKPLTAPQKNRAEKIAGKLQADNSLLDAALATAEDAQIKDLIPKHAFSKATLAKAMYNGVVAKFELACSEGTTDFKGLVAEMAASKEKLTGAKESLEMQITEAQSVMVE